MNTSTDTRGSLWRRHPEVICGPLVAVLLALAYWLSGPGMAVFVSVEDDAYPGVQSAATMILHTVVMAVAVFVALTSVSAVARSLSWIVLVTAWISDFFSFFMVETGPGWTEPVIVTLMAVWVAMPATVFLLVCWKGRRPRFDTYLGEAILLVLIAIEMGAYTPGYVTGLGDPGEVPVEGILLFLGAAAYFGFAAWLVPTRRIVYGVTALGGIAIAAFGTVLFTGGSKHNYVLFPMMALGIPTVGLLLQIAWWVRGKVNSIAAA